MMNLISSAFSGLIIGALARLFYPGAQDAGWIKTMLIGLAGSLLAGYVFHHGASDGIQRAGVLASILGAMVVIFAATRMGWV